MPETLLTRGPLPLEPRLLPKVWGGDALARLFGKALPGGEPLGESWEIYHRKDGSSVVSDGPLAGLNLARLLEEDREGLLGTSPGEAGTPFPLMVKFLDARDLLSIQVHPSWDYAARVEGDQGKAEAWVILEASPEARVFRGLLPGVSRKDLERASREGTVEKLLRSFRPRPGDLVWIPPGTVHGLGGGVAAYEVQTNSDVTYRLFDWNRLGRDGRPRELHLEKAMEVIDFASGPADPPAPREEAPGRTLLLETPWFRLERLSPPWRGPVGSGGTFTILTVTEGTVQVGGKEGRSAPAGATLLLPARLGPVFLEGRGCDSWSVLAVRPGKET